MLATTEVQIQQPSQKTSPIRGQNTGSSPSHEENSATEESIRQKADNEIIRAEIEVLRQRLEAEQLLRRREDLLHQLAMTQEWPEPQFGNGQEPRPEGSQEGRYRGRQRTSERDANRWDRTWRHLIDIADAKVMERKARVAYDRTLRNLARLHRAEQKAATLKRRYKDGEDPAEYSDKSEPSSGSSGSGSAGSEPRRREGGSPTPARESRAIPRTRHQVGKILRESGKISTPFAGGANGRHNFIPFLRTF